MCSSLHEGYDTQALPLPTHCSDTSDLPRPVAIAHSRGSTVGPRLDIRPQPQPRPTTPPLDHGPREVAVSAKVGGDAVAVAEA